MKIFDLLDISITQLYTFKGIPFQKRPFNGLCNLLYYNILSYAPEEIKPKIMYILETEGITVGEFVNKFIPEFVCPFEGNFMSFWWPISNLDIRIDFLKKIQKNYLNVLEDIYSIISVYGTKSSNS